MEQFVMSYPALSRECLSSCWDEWSGVILLWLGQEEAAGIVQRGYMGLLKQHVVRRGELWNVLNYNKKLLPEFLLLFTVLSNTFEHFHCFFLHRLGDPDHREKINNEEPSVVC